ncbi:hypothetical protein LXA43DRAFT_1013369 [Ganoderma leucocontextum]|nr:hypothetical protein LXA43DRAFT_1013369 [Ganoderma leucocontextum]
MALSAIPLAYRLFFLYIEPVSALVGSCYAGGFPAKYLAYLTASPSAADLTRTLPPPTATLAVLYQLSNLYFLFALNEALVLRSTASLRTWRVLLFCLLIADFGHLATMIPLALEKGWAEVFVRFWAWDAMEWGSVGFVYAGASMRMAFLLGLGLGEGAKAKEE